MIKIHGYLLYLKPLWMLVDIYVQLNFEKDPCNIKELYPLPMCPTAYILYCPCVPSPMCPITHVPHLLIKICVVGTCHMYPLTPPLHDPTISKCQKDVKVSKGVKYQKIKEP